MRIEKADIQDAEDILALQKLAYSSEAELYNDFTIPPLIQTLAELQSELQTWVCLKAIVDAQIRGSVRAVNKAGTCYIGKLMVHPEFQGRGIGSKLLSQIEICCAVSKHFELFTGDKSERNIYLYQKAGYKVFKTETVSAGLQLVYLAKSNQRLA